MNLVSDLVSDGRRVLAAALPAADGPLDDDGVLREEDLEDGGPLRVDLAPVLLLVEHHVHRAVVVRGGDPRQDLLDGRKRVTYVHCQIGVLTPTLRTNAFLELSPYT